MGTYKEKFEEIKERQAFGREKMLDSRKRKHTNDREKKVRNQDLDHAIVQEKETSFNKFPTK